MLSEVISLSKSLSSSLEALEWEFSGTICNPLSYAWDNFESFLRLSVKEGQRVLFLGMNPGPYGMMQTGVPFGEIDAVRNYLGISGNIGEPAVNPPEKKIEGMNTRHHEISGRKFWRMAASYGTADAFFSVASVFSFCPLAFIDGRRNITPDELPCADRRNIDRICQIALSELLDIMKPKKCIALGHYAEKRLLKAGVSDVLYFPHPSPRSPLSMTFWDSGEALETFRRVLDEA